eukprot:Gb_23414 [translate_table: standard]
MGGRGIVFSFCCASVLYLVSAAVSDNFLIDCGTNSSTILQGRKWVGDLSAKNVSVTPQGISASTANVDSNVPYPDLYNTARLFTTSSNYSFKVTPGRHWVRLHFYPFVFQRFNYNSSVFSVNIGSLKLLSNFKVSDEISDRNADLQNSAFEKPKIVHLMKEYSINVESGDLILTFVPENGNGSFAFINAIEVVSMPKEMFPSYANMMGALNKVQLGLETRAVETMYRLNVGGQFISPEHDSGLSRTWEEDGYYMFTAAAGTDIHNKSSISYASPNESYIAPLNVYESARVMTNNQVVDKRFNISWKFSVDSNYAYLVRFHFCELEYAKPNMRVFKIYINNETAADNFDVYALAGAENRAIHTDFSSNLGAGVKSMWIQIGPDTTTAASYADAILNGLEIFKLSSKDSLIESPRKVDDEAGNSSGKNQKNKIPWPLIGAGAGGIAVIGAVVMGLCILCRPKKSTSVKPHSPGWLPLFLHGGSDNTYTTRASKGTINSANSTSTPSRKGRRFTFAEIRIATNGFDESLVIGIGGFGKVYKGEIEDATLVAIKRANPQSEQGLNEFETEIELLSKLRHRHLVSLIGYCDEQNEMILVYEYMANGTLRSHLFGSDLPPLPWKQRLDICIGAARGLHYLHTGAERGIIHRDVKTTNILLDENFVAKMADFGLSKTGPSLDHTHVSTAVKGSFGYLDPEYYRRQQLTEKSDVYSFGVVLFEVVCARPVINPTLPKEQINLAEWAMHWQERGMLEQIVDPHLVGTCNPNSLKKFGEIAEKCLADDGKNRPTMGDVLWHLEYVLQLHEAAARNDSLNNSSAQFAHLALNLPRIGELEEHDESTLIQDQDQYIDERSVGESEEAAGIVVFSQLVKPQGR